MILCKDIRALLHVISLVDWPKHVKFFFHKGETLHMRHCEVLTKVADLQSLFGDIDMLMRPRDVPKAAHYLQLMF